MDDEALLERLLGRIDKTDTCWLWQGTTTPLGYGQATVQRKSRYVHRLMYELLVGPIPPGLVIDHLCRVRNCVNPHHLEPVTQKVNTRRGLSSFDFATTCRKGHDVTAPGGLLTQSGHRRCAVCVRAQETKFHGFYADDELWEATKAEAERRGESVSKVIREILVRYARSQGDAA